MAGGRPASAGWAEAPPVVVGRVAGGRPTAAGRVVGALKSQSLPCMDPRAGRRRKRTHQSQRPAFQARPPGVGRSYRTQAPEPAAWEGRQAFSLYALCKVAPNTGQLVEQVGGSTGANWSSTSRVHVDTSCKASAAPDRCTRLTRNPCFFRDRSDHNSAWSASTLFLRLRAETQEWLRA